MTYINRQTWIACTMMEPLRDKKLLLKHGNNYYVGFFSYKSSVGKYYFIIDGYSKNIPRVASYWCALPHSLAPKDSPSETEWNAIDSIINNMTLEELDAQINPHITKPLNEYTLGLRPPKIVPPKLPNY